MSITSEYYDPETLGVFMNADDERKFYPYNILVWHEIVNDRIGGQELAITFCPLCGLLGDVVFMGHPPPGNRYCLGC